MNTNKKYYKALLKEPYMTSYYGDMTYEMNKKYIINGELEMCTNGYHYTDHIGCLSLWYGSLAYDIFEVIPSGKILCHKDEHKYCSSEIIITRQLSDEEIEELLYKDLDVLVNDNDSDIRYAVAKHGRDKDLDILVHDRDLNIRCIVAKHGRDKDLDILVNDENWQVRCIVAEYGRDKDLDILINDEDWHVRYKVTKHGRDKDLDILIADSDEYVRRAIKYTFPKHTILYRKLRKYFKYILLRK